MGEPTLADAVKRVAEYRDEIMANDDGLSADYQDGYIDGLDYALKLLDHDDD